MDEMSEYRAKVERRHNRRTGRRKTDALDPPTRGPFDADFWLMMAVIVGFALIVIYT